MYEGRGGNSPIRLTIAFDCSGGYDTIDIITIFDLLFFEEFVNDRNKIRWDREKRLQGGNLNPLEPSHEVVLEKYFHRFPRRARQVVKLQIHRRVNDDAKVSKSPI